MSAVSYSLAGCFCFGGSAGCQARGAGVTGPHATQQACSQGRVGAAGNESEGTAFLLWVKRVSPESIY